MSAVLCLPACLCVSPQRPVARPPTGTRHYSGTILVGEHWGNWLKPPLRTATPTRTLYLVLLKNMSWVLATLL